MRNDTLYEHDFYAWTREQSALLRAGEVSALDAENLAEEIESMGKRERRELVNSLAVLLLHLLKWQYQPSLRGNSWRLTIEEQRLRLTRHLNENPSLKATLDELMADAYELGRIGAQRETGLTQSALPATTPYSFAQIMDDGFWPE